jgi:WD40 repeat protein
VAFSPDGKTLSAGATADPKAGPKTGPQANGITYLWDVKTGKQIRTFSPGGGAEAFSPDGSTLATAGGPGSSSTYLWDVATDRKIATLNDHHHSRIKSVAFSASGGLLAVNDANGTVYVWKLPRGRGAPSIHAVLSLQGFVNSDAVAFSPQGATLVMGGSDGQAYLWNATTGNIRALAAPVGSEITSVAYSPDGQELAAGDTGGVTYVWNLATGNGVTLPDPDSMGIESVAFGPGNESLATGDTNGKTYVWHLPATKPVKTLANPTTASAPLRAAVFSVAFSPRGTLATIDTDGHAYLWKVR